MSSFSGDLQDELNLNLYDYGARNYDPALGRWVNIDPMAEKFIGLTPYAYVANNPTIFFDPDGKDIYRYDSKTGELRLVEANDDKHDQIVHAEYNKETKQYEAQRKDDGTLKKSSIIIDDIAKNIMHDGMNMRNENNTIAVNGTNEDGSKQATTDQVLDFVVDFANYIAGVEISGFALGYSSDNITNILLEGFKSNSSNYSATAVFKKDEFVPTSYLNLKDGFYNSAFMTQYHFHTHLDKHVPTSHPSDFPGGDMDHKNDTGNLLHYIINSNGKHKF